MGVPVVVGTISGGGGGVSQRLCRGSIRGLIQGYRLPALSWLFVQLGLAAATKSQACFDVNP